MSEIKRIAEAVRNAINGTVIMQVDEALARIVTNQMEGIVGVELRVATDGVVAGNFISDVLLNNDGSDILRELSLRARARSPQLSALLPMESKCFSLTWSSVRLV